MGDRASRSVMGNSRPRFLKSSYTCTTPPSEAVLRKASAHDCRVDTGATHGGNVRRQSQNKANIIIPVRLGFHMRKQRNASKYSKRKGQCRPNHMCTDITGLEGKSCGILNSIEIPLGTNTVKVLF